MRKIRTLIDINYIVKMRMDVFDPDKRLVPFTKFLSFTLLEIINITHEGTWTYSLD